MEGSHGLSFGNLQVFRLGAVVYMGVGVPVILGVVYGEERSKLMARVEPLEGKLE